MKSLKDQILTLCGTPSQKILRTILTDLCYLFSFLVIIFDLIRLWYESIIHLTSVYQTLLIEMIKSLALSLKFYVINQRHILIMTPLVILIIMALFCAIGIFVSPTTCASRAGIIFIDFRIFFNLFSLEMILCVTRSILYIPVAPITTCGWWFYKIVSIVIHLP
jgi:hypothetical protein